MDSGIQNLIISLPKDFITTAFSVIVGGIFSCIGGYIAARRAAKAQLNAAAQSAFIPARLSAFQDFEAALESWSNCPTPGSYAAIYRAANAVRLVASIETIIALKSVLDYLRGLELETQAPSFDEFAQRHNALLDCMRKDLLAYPVPKPAK